MTQGRWSERTTLVALFGVGLVVHALWALTAPFPPDMDSQYYRLVAERILAGHGATTASLWNHSWAPDALPVPADMHWMPLPSRILLPGLALWPAHGDQLTSVVLAALWGPIAWRLARKVGDRQALLAAVIAISGGVLARPASTPDVYALQAVLGGLGLLAVVEQRILLAAAVAAAMALARNDGVLFGFLFAAVLPTWRRWLPALSGGVAASCWFARNWMLGGAAWLAGRRISVDTDDYLALFDGVARPALGVAGRVGALVDAWPMLLEFVLTPGLIVLTVPAWIALYARRSQPWARLFALMMFALPVLEVLVAPAIAVHGTLHRTGAALLIGHAVLAADGLDIVAERLHALRGYARPFTLSVLAGAFFVIAVGTGLRLSAGDRPAVDCAALAGIDGPVLSSRPLEVELRCGVPGVMITRTMTPDRVAGLVARYDLRAALVEAAADEGSVTAREAETLLPGWRPGGPGVWVAPPPAQP